MPIYRLGGVAPRIHPDAWVHPDAVVIGDVSIESHASIWPGAVLRGDFGRIEIGPRTSIQDGTIVHAGGAHPTIIGASCVVGHKAHLEGAIVEDAVLVGSSSVVLKATVETGAAVAAGAVVLDGLRVPAGSRAQGVPATLVPHETTADAIREGAERYVRLAQRYVADCVPIAETRGCA